MEFCKKYDVDVIFHAMKNGIDSVETAVCVFYDNIAKSKFKKFLDSLGNSKDKVVIHGWGNKYNLDESMKEASANLKAAISPENLK